MSLLRGVAPFRERGFARVEGTVACSRAGKACVGSGGRGGGVTHVLQVKPSVE